MRRVLDLYSVSHLNVSPHVQLGQHLVTLVQDEMFQVLQVQLLGLHQGCKCESQSTVKTVNNQCCFQCECRTMRIHADPDPYQPLPSTKFNFLA
jgi:hypothetical protein